ncbi:NADPH-dependent FMN reductase [Kutzneria sp. NPDC052558]|uniref:NADPH-dependent FMN reductase n=1 Tax=Kutzneria sp. NPDC052558 TaxID=3364121 RepID=UPI0037C79351
MPRLLAISGSSRQDSFNTRLLRAVPALAPEDMTWDWCDSLGELPLYDQDRDNHEPPPAVARLRAAIRAADGLVIAAPEYNHSISGVLKNAIDWASRPMKDPPLTGKGVVLLVATVGRALGFRGLAETSQILHGLGNIVVPQPEIVVNTAHAVLGADGAINDPMTEHLIGVQLKVLGDVLAHDMAGLLSRSIAKHWETRFAHIRD